MLNRAPPVQCGDGSIAFDQAVDDLGATG
jgi:hypothetical protein